jgi:AcrR family transcriptional regulator
MEAVFDLLKETSVRDLTIEAVAKRAGVGKPTIYKWWPTKAELVLAMYRERIVPACLEPGSADSAESAIRDAVVALIRVFKGPLGKVMTEIIAEGQSEPSILRKLFDEHIRVRRAVNASDIELGKKTGEIRPETDPELLIDSVFGALYYRMLFKSAPLTEEFGKRVVRQVFLGAKVAERTTPKK